jgi:uncharacterized lipoprotein
MVNRALYAFLAVIFFSLSGCVFSPQQLSPAPVLDSNIQPVGRGQNVLVRVVDARPSPVLGTRGGLYPDTSTISVQSQVLMPKLQGEVEAAVRLLGFTPTNAAAYNTPQLVVTLTDLHYQSPKNELYVTEATISATLKVEVLNAGRRYEGRYSASLTQHFGTAPNEPTNTKLVSDVLSDALNRTFRDRTIGSELAQ